MSGRKPIDDPAAFALSRAYAAGWIAGKAAVLGDEPGALEAAEAAQNPCKDPRERERWADGFGAGVRKAWASGPRRAASFR